MARQGNGFALQGRLGGLCFYKTRDGYFVRTTGSVSKARIKSDPAFARTRQHNAEFKQASHGVKTFRTAFRSLLQRIGEKGATGRLVSMMLKVIRADVINDLGLRTINDGAPQLLDGFEFNENAKLCNILIADLTASIDRKASAMTIDINAPSVARMISIPPGATHFRFFSGAAVIDFEHDAYSRATSETDCFSVTRKRMGRIHLSHTIEPRRAGHSFLLLGIEFLCIVKGVQASFGAGRHNALAIVKIG